MTPPLRFLSFVSCAALLSAALHAQPAGADAAVPNVMMGASGAARFVRVQELDFLALLPSPPPAGSIAAAADLDTVLQVQASRSPEDIAWARTIEKDDVFLNRAIVGEWLEPSNLPVTAAFFRSLATDLKAIDTASKLPFKRHRPYEVDARVKPCVSLPSSSSYPSGSALQALVWAELLAELVPGKRAALLERAHRAAWGRVIGGVHFPTDIEAGRRLAAPFLAACRANPEFRARFDAVREEFAGVSNK